MLGASCIEGKKSRRLQHCQQDRGTHAAVVVVLLLLLLLLPSRGLGFFLGSSPPAAASKDAGVFSH
jgi:hypothetical protein